MASYAVPPVGYTLANLDSLLHPDTLWKNRNNVIRILENWKGKFPNDSLSKLVIVTSSGGFQRAGLWALKVLQSVHEINNGDLIKHATLFTGASGGVMGEVFFREIYVQSLTDFNILPKTVKYQDQISADNLNPIIFSLLVNDLIIRNQFFIYNNRRYLKDRGFAFENQLNINTKGILDKTIFAYAEPELKELIHLLPVTSLITNDGRKSVVSPNLISFYGISMLGTTDTN